ncbi:MAG: YdcF family protein [Verrucomicrobia bacterium]|nr:YdcF family protein [Verrucomicrobiota bacterium]
MTSFWEPLLQPLGFLWLLHVLATLWMFRSRKWREAVFCGAIASAISVIGSTRVPARLLASLERPYATQNLTNLPPCDAVVMLGGTLNASNGDPLGFDVGEPADRILAAVELFKRKHAEVLILGGGGGRSRLPPGNPWSEGEVMKAWLASLGVTGTNVFPLRNCANTREEAVQVAAMARERQWKRVLLVTSAYHMKRAAGLFVKLGIPVEPVACDFVGLATLQNQKRWSPFPKTPGFHHFDLYLHEWIGWLYYRLRGWVESRSERQNQ